MTDPVATTRRELAIRYAARGTTLQLARAVTVLEATGGVDTAPAHPCRHAITSLGADFTVECLTCGATLS